MRGGGWRRGLCPLSLLSPAPPPEHPCAHHPHLVLLLDNHQGVKTWKEGQKGSLPETAGLLKPLSAKAGGTV